jgi:hypothetical protein
MAGVQLHFMSPPRTTAPRRTPAERIPLPRRREASGDETTDAESILGTDEATLLDIVDNVLSKGVVLTGDVTIGLAHVDLVYARVSLLLCAADRIMPGEDPEPMARQADRHAARVRVKAARASAGVPRPRR